ncbi:MAG: 5-(carboxyamino)imidazole ribonucleotide synthase [Flavobacteriaceae bacterium]
MSSAAHPLAPRSTVGILGGGQLGRMLAVSAAELGFRCHIFCPDPESPAFDVAAARTVAAYEDEAALDAFAAACDVVTYEFENVPAATAARLAARVPVRPGPKALDVSQDRLREKRFLESVGLAVAPWRPVGTAADLARALAEIGPRAILKTTRFGYDGKGQVRVTAGDDPEAAIAAAGAGPYVLEGLVDFEREISVVAARGADGSTVAYDPAENVHRDQILWTSTVPASISKETRKAALAAATRILDALDYVGVVGVEFFALPGGGLVVNEIAPRVHNTGHWTQDACAASQFEMHIRAIAGWPLAPSERLADCVMTNLIGDDAGDWAEIAARTDARLHLYGKAETRPGRKMGHWTRLLPKSA